MKVNKLVHQLKVKKNHIVEKLKQRTISSNNVLNNFKTIQINSSTKNPGKTQTQTILKT